MFTIRHSIAATAAVFTLSTVFAQGPSAPKDPVVPSTPAQDTANIIKVLKNSANYKTLVELLNLTGLTPTLEGSAQFTIFAPTDAAFAELSAEKMTELKGDTAMLKKILSYHVVTGSIAANQVVKLKTARTIQGPRIEFMMKDGQMQVNNAAMIQPDIKASNGVIHGISKVLMLPK